MGPTCGKIVLIFLLGVLPSLMSAQIFLRTRPHAYLITGENPAAPYISIPRDGSFLRLEEMEDRSGIDLGAFELKEKLVSEPCEQVEVKNAFQEGDSIRLIVEHCGCQAEMRFWEDASSPKRVQFVVSTSCASINRLSFRFLSRPEERFMGFGEQFSHLDMKGKKPVIHVEEQGIGRGDKGVTGKTKLVGVAGNEYTSYFPLPVTLTSDLRAIVLTDLDYQVWDLTDPESVEITVRGREIQGAVFYAKTPLKLLEGVTEVIGRPELPLPEWSYGTWLGVQGGAEKVKEVVKEAKSAGNPVTAVWIQDWVGKRKTKLGSRLWWNWKADPDSYPNFAAFCRGLEAEEVKVLGYINPHLATDRELGKHALQKGYVIKDAEGEPLKLAMGGFDGYLVNVFDKKAANWLKSVMIENMIRPGMDGWMADFGEYLPWDVFEDPSQSIGDDWHHLYVKNWNALSAEAIREAGRQEDMVYFCRSGVIGSQVSVPIYWAGDQTPNWGENDGFPSAVKAMISSGMSGVPVNHTDIGGYTNIHLPILKVHRDRELLYRWTEFAAFTPIFRSHEGLMPERNVQPWSDKEAVDFFAHFGKIHWAMRDYFAYLHDKAREFGWPMIRHLWLHYPNEPRIFDYPYQYLLGPDLLVIPVVKPEVEFVEGYFPEGQWEHVFTGEVLRGRRQHLISTPLGQPAVFLKRGGKWSDRLRSAFEAVGARD